MKTIKNYNKTPIEFFDVWAKNGKDEGMEKGHNQAVEFMIKKIREFKLSGKRGIDIGCGNGWTVRKMKKMLQYQNIIGIDGSKKMIKKAQKMDPTGVYKCQDLTKHNPKEKYDFIHSMEVLYYLENPEVFIKNVYKNWQKKDGIFILGIDHYNENTASINWPEECGVYMNTKSKEEWIKIIQNAGYKDINSKQVFKQKNWAGTLVIIGKK